MGFERLKFMCGAKVGEFIYASCMQFNGLAKINSITGDCKILGKFPNEPLCGEYLHKMAFVVDSNIYFIPHLAKNICRYDVQNGKFNNIEIQRENYKGGYIAEKILNKIYMISESAGGNIVEYDTATNMQRVIISSVELIAETKDYISENLIFFRACSLKDHLFLPIRNSNIILEIDIKNKSILCHKLKIKKIWGCFKGNKGIWILNCDVNKVYLWNIDKDIIEFKIDMKYTRTERNLNWIVELKKGIYAIPAWGNNISKLKQGKFVSLCQIERDSKIERQKFYTPIIDNEVMYLLSMDENQLVIINDEIVRMISINPIYKDTILYKKIIKSYINSSDNNCFIENEKLELHQFIDGVIYGK